MQKLKVKRKAILSRYLTILALVAIDLIIKYYVEINLRPYGTISFIDGILHFTYVQNPGAAFGLLRGSSAFLSVFTAIILIGILIFLALPYKTKKLETICLLLIASGGLGNLVDRTIRGYVVDYLQALPAYIDFPVFNFADCLITVGSFVLIGCLIYEIILEFMAPKQKTAVAEASPEISSEETEQATVSEEKTEPADTDSEKPSDDNDE